MAYYNVNKNNACIYACTGQPGTSVQRRAQAGCPDFCSWQRQGIFLYSTASRPALKSTQPPIQLVPAVLFPGVKRSGREADQSLPSCTEAKNGGATLLLPHTSSWCDA
jgi:hypothetical protein